MLGAQASERTVVRTGCRSGRRKAWLSRRVVGPGSVKRIDVHLMVLEIWSAKIKHNIAQQFLYLMLGDDPPDCDLGCAIWMCQITMCHDVSIIAG